MSESLQDQLIKAGLASENQAQPKPHRPRKPKRGKRRTPAEKAQRAAAAARPAAVQPVQAEVATSKRPQTQVRRALLQDIREAAKRDRKMLAKRTRASLQEARCNDAKATIAHHFVRGKKIKRVYVTEEQQLALKDGALAVAVYDGATFLVHGNVRRELEALNPDVFFASAEASGASDEVEHPVPDDITW